LEVTVGAGASPGRLLYPRPPTPYGAAARAPSACGRRRLLRSRRPALRTAAPSCCSQLSPAGEPDDRAGYQPGQDPSSGGGEGHDGEPKPSVGQEAGQDEAEAATDLVADRDGIMCLNHRRDYITPALFSIRLGDPILSPPRYRIPSVGSSPAAVPS
jgi:hypothetical protein